MATVKQIAIAVANDIRQNPDAYKLYIDGRRPRSTLADDAKTEIHRLALSMRKVSSELSVGDDQAPSWTDDAKTELHVLALNLHNLSIELSRQHPCAATILEGYAIRIDELMKRAPEAAT